MINCLIPRLGLTCPDDPLPEAVLYVVYSLYAVSLIMFITIGTVKREYVELGVDLTKKSAYQQSSSKTDTQIESIRLLL
jgi:hypothetical protein